MKTIYRKDSKGKIRIIEVSTEGALLIQKSGLIDGKLVTNKKVCKPKNIGKINETNGEEQAIIEANSFIKDKLDKGYFETEQEARNEIVILPMLAKDYKKEKQKINWDENCVFIQPKLDGMRCIAIKKGDNLTLLSRAGKIIDTVPHIIEDLLNINQDFIIDGELYAHGEDFQKNMTLIKKYRPNETEKVKYHFYDSIIGNLTFVDRFVNNSNLSIFETNNIKPVLTKYINNEHELVENHNKFIGEGYEGSIIRWGNEEYKINGRSSNLLKYKDFLDRTAEIVDVIPSENRPEQGVLVCRFNKVKDNDIDSNVNNDTIFKSNLKFSHKEREYILEHKHEYIGKVAELRFFEYTNDGIPRFPVCVGFRLDK